MSSANSVSHEIARCLRNEILRGHYRVGERLSSERDLSTRFAASRGAVREALLQLEQLGIISIQPGGVRVQSINSASLAILGPLMALNELPVGSIVDQFLQVFGLLTSSTAKSSVEKASAEQLSHMQELVAKLAEQSEQSQLVQVMPIKLLEYMTGVDDNLVLRLIGNDLKEHFVEQMLKVGVKPQLQLEVGPKLFKALSLSLAQKNGDAAAKAFQEYFDQLRLSVMDALELKKENYSQA